MDPTQLGWLLIGLAMGGNGALAWRLGRSLKGRTVAFVIYSAVLSVLWLILDGLFGALASWIQVPGLLELWRWLPVGLGAFWLAAISVAFLRLRRYEY